MKLVTAVVRADKLDPVKEALRRAGVVGMTITEAQGVGREHGPVETYRGSQYTVDVVPRTRVELLADDADVARVVDAVVAAARTGEVGDGRVWVTPVEAVVHVRTGQPEAPA